MQLFRSFCSVYTAKDGNGFSGLSEVGTKAEGAVPTGCWAIVSFQYSEERSKPPA